MDSRTSNQRAHTPGPWDVFGAQDSSSDEWRALTVSQASMPFMRVCFMPSDGTETIMADACLIAAAPDLLDGCNALLGLLQLIAARDDMPEQIREVIRSNHRVGEAQSAIAKATGAAHD